ncbi:MAG: transglycosylase domain-containing protein [Acidimicrobiales bacterium]
MSPRARRASKRAQRKAQRARDKAAGKRVGFFWRWRRVFFLLGLVVVLAIAGVGYLFTQVPLPAKDPPLLQTTFFCAADVTSGCNADNSLAQLSGGEDRVTVTYDQIPPVLVDAVLSAEDRTYFKHGGVDPVGVARALWADLRSSGSQQGGSTITQQYVKNVYLTDERTVTRKVKEAVLAVKLERELPKTEILNRYLNTIYFGRGAYGVQAASKTYFGKNVGDLTLADAAYLAGLIRAPEVADAKRADTDPQVQSNLETAIRRRTSVLDAMLLENYITQEQHDAAVKDEFNDVLPRKQVENYGTIAHTDIGTQYFVNYVDQWLTSSGNFTAAEVRGGGLRVYTTLDYNMQADAVDAVQSTLGRGTDPESALVALDTQGHVRAMYGGRDYNTLQVNLATGDGGSGRPAGSTFKAFAVAEALKQGIGLETSYNAPAQITIPKADGGKDWKPRNDDDAAYGQVNMVKATASSINTYFAQLVMDIDPDNLASLATRMGVESPLKPVPSLVLGTSAVSPLDMASGYSTFMDEGEHVDPVVVTRVTDSSGRVLYDSSGKRSRVLDKSITDQVSWDLSGVIADGTGTGAQFGQPAAGKTGTTQDHRDAWFVGYTCSITASVWNGFVDNSPMDNVRGKVVFGGTYAAPIWGKFMAKATQGRESCPYDRPSDVSGRVGDITSGTGSTVRSGTTSTTAQNGSTTTSSTTPGSTTTTEKPATTTTTAPSSTTTTSVPVVPP